VVVDMVVLGIVVLGITFFGFLGTVGSKHRRSRHGRCAAKTNEHRKFFTIFIFQCPRMAHSAKAN
jgi:hypothetical protein